MLGSISGSPILGDVETHSHQPTQTTVFYNTGPYTAKCSALKGKGKEASVSTFCVVQREL